MCQYSGVYRMIREVDLVSYLPLFLAEYKEINAALTAENPEFLLIWDGADRVLRNEFIATADEYGISRFEKMLGILPSKRDTLEKRRLKVQSRWFTALPYTWRMLIKKLSVLCGGREFRVYMPEKESYEIRVDIPIEPESEYLLQETQQMLEQFLPANLWYLVTGIVYRRKEAKILVGAIRTVSIKIKAEPEDKNSHNVQQEFIKVRSVTFNHTKIVYKPKEQK